MMYIDDLIDEYEEGRAYCDISFQEFMQAKKEEHPHRLLMDEDDAPFSEKEEEELEMF